MTACQSEGPKYTFRSNYIPLRYHRRKFDRHTDCRLDAVALDRSGNVYWEATPTANEARLSKTDTLSSKSHTHILSARITGTKCERNKPEH